MSKQNEIRQALVAIDQATFQLLCIDYLKHNIEGTIDSPGTTLAKQKTRTGHPDIYMVQKDGQYVFAECTTKDDKVDRNAFYKKLEKDLLDCLDFDKINIPKEKISSIYLFTNSSFLPAERNLLVTHASSFDIHLELIGLFELTAYLSSSGKLIAKDKLGIAYLTGQIMTKEQFLTKYQNKNISTPLDNPLVGRQEAIKNLVEKLSTESLILLSGDPGVGKTKLAIEAISKFADMNPDYSPFYVMSKSGEIFEDLETFIKPEKNYILLVDDANRQLDNLTRILDRLIESQYNIKILITVREYAKRDVIRHLVDHTSCNLELQKLNDQEIKEIISGAPFSLKSLPIIERIQKVSNGNARLAIMAADTMKENPDIKLLSDVSRIYDSYFKSIFFDKPLFEDRLTRQVMGVVSFFRTIDITDEVDCETIKGFGIDIGEFSTRAQQLEETEVVEIYDKSIIRISEQVMATYFFYDSFFRKSVLDFEHLTTAHFEKYPYRFKESLLGAIDAFGEDNVIVLKKQILLSYWESRKSDKSFALLFLRFFCRFFPELTFVWLDEYIDYLPNLTTDPLQQSGKFHQLIDKTDEEIFYLFETFLSSFSTHFQSAVHLLLKYAIRENKIIDKLVEKMAHALFISNEEISQGLTKLNFVYNELLEKIQSDLFYKKIFFPLMDKAILSPSGREEFYEQFEGRYKLKSKLAQFRIKFLKQIEAEFQSNPILGFNLILDYVSKKHNLRYPEIESDFIQINKIITKQFYSNSFPDCYVVNRYITLVEQKTSFFQSEISLLKNYFQIPTLQLYQLLSMRTRDRTDNLSYDDFFAQRSEVITRSIKINKLSDFILLHKQLIEITNFEETKSDIGSGLTILFRKLLEEDINIGFECLSYYLSQGNVARLLAGSVYAPIFQTTNKRDSKKLYQIISSYQYPEKQEWMIRFFHFLPQSFFDSSTFKDLFDCLNDHVGVIDIYQSHYDKFEQIRPGTLERILKIMINKHKKNNGFLYTLSHSFFKDSLANLKNNIKLCEIAYYQQYQIQSSYDTDCKELLLLTSLDNMVFKRFLDQQFKNKKKINLGAYLLGGIWKYDFASKIVYDTILRISKLKSYEKSEHSTCAFLYGIEELHHNVAYKLFSKLIDDHQSDINLINTVLDMLRNTNKLFYLAILQQLVRQNHSIDFFSQFELHNNHFNYNTAENWPEHKIKELTEIKNSIIEMPNSYKFFAITNHLDIVIANQKKYSGQERKYKFRGFW